jgi:hypothetical protein
VRAHPGMGQGGVQLCGGLVLQQDRHIRILSGHTPIVAWGGWLPRPVSFGVCQSLSGSPEAETTEAAPKSAKAAAKPRLRRNIHKFISPPDWLSPSPSASSWEAILTAPTNQPKAVSCREVTGRAFRRRPDASHPYSSELRPRCCWSMVLMSFLFLIGRMVRVGGGSGN